MMAGFTRAYLVKLGLLHWHCSQKPRQIIGIYCVPMSGIVLSLCLTLSYRMGRRFLSGIAGLALASSWVSLMSIHP
eukprot:CCRYP_005473-RA/>CCRYP_005473-RA protein AED:0.43 eAED:1.00 QI:0/-1/0/1/-1/0/1/0/75